MLGDAGSHVEPSSDFDRLKVIPATEKRQNHKRDV